MCLTLKGTVSACSVNLAFIVCNFEKSETAALGTRYPSFFFFLHGVTRENYVDDEFGDTKMMKKMSSFDLFELWPFF